MLREEGRPGPFRHGWAWDKGCLAGVGFRIKPSQIPRRRLRIRIFDICRSTTLVLAEYVRIREGLAEYQRVSRFPVFVVVVLIDLVVVVEGVVVGRGVANEHIPLLSSPGQRRGMPLYILMHRSASLYRTTERSYLFWWEPELKMHWLPGTAWMVARRIRTAPTRNSMLPHTRGWRHSYFSTNHCVSTRNTKNES